MNDVESMYLCDLSYRAKNFVVVIFFLERTSKSPKQPKSTAPSLIGGSFAGTATVQGSISFSQSQSTTKNFKPHTIKGSTTMVTKSKPITP